MPIARFEMADGRIARFEVPEGTTPEQAQAQIAAMIAQQPPVATQQQQGTMQPQVAPQAPIEAQQMQAAQTEAQPQQGFIGGVTEDLAARNKAIQETMQSARQGDIGSLQGTIQSFGQVAGGAADVLGQGVSAIAGAAPDYVKDLAIKTVEDLGRSIPFKDEAIAAIQGGSEMYNEWKTENPNAAKTLESALNLGMFLAPVKGAPLKVKAAETGAKEARAAVDAAEIARVRESLGINKEASAAIDATKPKTNPLDAIKADIDPEVQDYNQVLSNIQREKTKKAVIDAMPNKEIMDAASDLGVDLNPDHYSDNRVFRELTQRLKDRPGSQLGTIEEKAIRDLGQRADDLIRDIGGQTDKTLLDVNVRSDIDSTIGALEQQASAAYKAVDDAIPKAVKVKPEAARAYLKNTLQELGGDKASLSGAEKKLLTIISKNPTYSALDRLRKDVGEGFRKNTGPYKDDNPSSLKQVYRVLSEDQQGVSDSFGVGADYAAARRLIVSRKQIEDEAIKLFGRDAQGSIVPKITGAATALTKGDTSKFDKLMKAIPENRRGEAAATMLNDLFTQGTRTNQPLGQGFVKAYEGLNRNAGAKNILFNELPKEARVRFDKIGRVATGIFRSKALENTSKTAGSLIAAMDDGGMFSKVYDVGKKVAVAETVSTAVGIPGAGASAVLGAAFVKGKTTATQAADKFITSKKFKDAIEQSARQGDNKVADEILKTSQEYNKWKKYLSKEEAARLAAIGFISYITEEEGK